MQDMKQQFGLEFEDDKVDKKDKRKLRHDKWMSSMCTTAWEIHAQFFFVSSSHLVSIPLSLIISHFVIHYMNSRAGSNIQPSEEEEKGCPEPGFVCRLWIVP